MSDFETVALILVFLVLSFVIVRLIGGDADQLADTSGGARQAGRPIADPLPPRHPDEADVAVVSRAQAAPVVQPQAARAVAAPTPTPPRAAEPVRPSPAPIEAAMVKIERPLQTPISAAPTVSPTTPAASSPSAAESLSLAVAAAAAAAAIANAAKVAAVSAPTAARPVQASAPQVATPVVATPAIATPAVLPPSGPVPPSIAGTLQPAGFKRYVAPQKPAEPEAVAVAAPTAAPPKAAPTVTTPVILSRRDVKATLAPGASLVTSGSKGPAWTPSNQTLSAEEHAILVRGLRPDAKATLYREPASAAPVPTKAEPKKVETGAPLAQADVAVAADTATIPLAETTPVAVSAPNSAATLPPGYVAPAPAVAPKPFADVTEVPPLGLHADINATLPRAAPTSAPTAVAAAAGTVATAAVASVVEAVKTLEPRALRAASIEPSTAVAKPAAEAATAAAPSQPVASEPVAAQVVAAQPVAVQAASSQTVSADPQLLSTAKRGTRVIGAVSDEIGPLDLSPQPTPRPQSSTIWSNTPRRAVTEGDLSALDTMANPPTVRAERIPVRAEPILVRPDATRTLAPGYVVRAPQPMAKPVAPVAANDASQDAADAAKRKAYANWRFTLPPGALEDAGSSADTSKS